MLNCLLQHWLADFDIHAFIINEDLVGIKACYMYLKTNAIHGRYEWWHDLNNILKSNLVSVAFFYENCILFIILNLKHDWNHHYGLHLLCNYFQLTYIGLLSLFEKGNGENWHKILFQLRWLNQLSFFNIWFCYIKTNISNTFH